MSEAADRIRTIRARIEELRCPVPHHRTDRALVAELAALELLLELSGDVQVTSIEPAPTPPAVVLTAKQLKCLRECIEVEEGKVVGALGTTVFPRTWDYGSTTISVLRKAGYIVTSGGRTMITREGKAAYEKAGRSASRLAR